ncbi:MAG: RES family NAD+ phosphorylase [Pyrinomonadaceae bacterium]
MAGTLERKLQRRMPHVLKLAVKFQGVGFRNVGQRFANKRDILSTKGSYSWGGRYNVARDFGALYLSCDLHTCIEELEYAARKDGFTVEEKLPRTMTGIRVELVKVLDLTDSKVRRELGISRKILMETDWVKENSKGNDAATQIIGRAAKGVGFEALLVPSARWPGKNLNLLDDGNLLSRVSVINGDTIYRVLGPKKRVGKRRHPLKKSS